VLVLNHYGKDMVNSLTQAVQFGLRDKQVNGKDFEIVVPLYSRLMAQGAGDAVKGIFGSTNWHWSLQDEGSKAFVKAFGEKYGFPPSQAAHTCYCQAILYADACQRAGTFPRLQWARRSKASSSTAWATARPSTALPTTSASRTFWS
jgi:branched-chain amino acid transport system substrate-binding protein